VNNPSPWAEEPGQDECAGQGNQNIPSGICRRREGSTRNSVPLTSGPPYVSYWGHANHPSAVAILPSRPNLPCTTSLENHALSVTLATCSKSNRREKRLAMREQGAWKELGAIATLAKSLRRSLRSRSLQKQIV
jgi:hypothetical protein